jgi:hypothetical protein
MQKGIREMTKETLRRVLLSAVVLVWVESLSIQVKAQQPSPTPPLRPEYKTLIDDWLKPRPGLRPKHKAIVESWLKLRPDLRLATDADNKNQEGLASTRNERGHNYNPYYVVGDFNGDKQEDFALALVRKEKSRWPFVFVIYNGPAAQATKPTFSVDADLTDGGIFYNPENPPSGFRLAFGTFHSDNCVIVSPSRQTYVTRPCLNE